MEFKTIQVKIRTDYQTILKPALLKFRFLCLTLLLLIDLMQPTATVASPIGSTPKSIRYMIVVTGSELLSGAYPDGHTHFLTRTLKPLGLQCVGSMCINDKQESIKEALRFALSKANLIIVTGGLGPTDNDITRETLADFTGIVLKEHPEVLQQMSRRFNVSPARLRPNLRRQTLVPTDGTYFKNPNGTAVGLVFTATDAVIIALPGPPNELQAMVRNELVPYLSRRFGTRLPGCSITLRFVGLGQSQIDQTLKDHVHLASDVTVSSQFQGGLVDFTFSLPDDTPKDRVRLQQIKKKIMKHLGEYVYADDETSLGEHIVNLLKIRETTLALVEVGSGGSLTSTLISVNGARQVLAGSYVAPNMEKLRYLLRVPHDQWAKSTSPRQRTKRLAIAAAEATGSQWAVAVGDSWQDKSGDSYVDVSFKLSGDHLESRKVRLRGIGELARLRLSTQIQDMLRRKLR
jgi:nicotinamide-nucleotide amidase